MKKIFLIEGCNFNDYPKGGQLSFCTQLLDVFPNEYFKLIGLTTDPNNKIGNWQKIKIKNKTYDFFPLYFTRKRISKGLIPGRLKLFITLLKYRVKLFKDFNQIRLFTHAPETLLALKIKSSKFKVMHFMHGVENPLSMPRFRWGKFFAILFWRLYLKKLKQADYILAAADNIMIKNFQLKNDFQKKIKSFPTRYDDTIFKPFNKLKSKKGTFAYCGRINVVKGWELLINSFIYYLKNIENAQLIVIGDGEDRIKLENIVKENGISRKVTITGFLNKNDVSEWLNKAHVYLLPSFKEGWPIAMIEALGCGLPVVSSNVGGANKLINEGENGFIEASRDSKIFAHLMHKALKLGNPNTVSLKIATNYRATNLKKNLLSLYPEFFTDI